MWPTHDIHWPPSDPLTDLLFFIEKAHVKMWNSIAISLKIHKFQNYLILESLNESVRLAIYMKFEKDWKFDLNFYILFFIYYFLFFLLFFIKFNAFLMFAYNIIINTIYCFSNSFHSFHITQDLSFWLSVRPSLSPFNCLSYNTSFFHYFFL